LQSSEEFRIALVNLHFITAGLQLEKIATRIIWEAVDFLVESAVFTGRIGCRERSGDADE
jgi:hypothetical protein